MGRKQINEKQLLTDARLWFEQKHGKKPEECNVKFIQVWFKPTPLIKTTAVIFAPTEEIGKAFLWEQNVILRAMGNFWLVAVVYIIFMFLFFGALSQDNINVATEIVAIFGALCLGALCFFCYLSKKCKKLEKIHQWNVDVYYP